MYQVDNYTVSLLHFDDSFKDETGKVWKAQNGAITSSSKSLVGISSLYLNGVNQYISCPSCDDFNFSSGDFTIDFYHANNNPSAVEQVLFNYGESISTSAYEISLFLENKGLTVQVDYNGNNYVMLTSQNAINDNEWHHIAVVRSGSILYLFIDGKVAVQRDIDTISLNAGSNEFRIGTGSNYNGLYYTNGYFDEFRISKGIARWTEDFDLDPVKTSSLLRITMNDSSEREYRLTTNETDDFIKWFNHHTSTDTMSYAFNDIVDKSKEYLSFEKIISFRVIPIAE